MTLLERPLVGGARDVSLRDPVRVHDSWLALCQATAAPPFFRPEWYRYWAASFAPGRLRVAVVTRDGHVVAALPLLAGPMALRAPVNGHTPFYGPLGIDDAARHRLLDGVVELAGRGLSLDQLLLDHDDLAHLDQAFAARRWHRRIEMACHTRSTDVTGTLVDFVAGLQAGRRREMQRSLRRTERFGDVEFEVHRGTGGLPTLLAECLAIEASGWKGREGTAINSQAATCRFYEAVTHWAAEQGWLELATLRIDRRLAAFQLALRHDGVLYLLKTGYEDGLSAAAPGKALLHEIVRRAFEDPAMRRLEWLGDDGELKRVLGPLSLALHRVIAHPPGASGYIRHLATASSRRTGDWARDRLPPPVRARLRATRNRWSGRQVLAKDLP